MGKYRQRTWKDSCLSQNLYFFSSLIPGFFRLLAHIMPPGCAVVCVCAHTAYFHTRPKQLMIQEKKSCENLWLYHWNIPQTLHRSLLYIKEATRHSYIMQLNQSYTKQKLSRKAENHWNYQRDGLSNDIWQCAPKNDGFSGRKSIQYI